MNSHYYDVQDFSLKIFSHNLKNGNTTKNFSSNINVLITTTTLKVLVRKNANSI